MPKLKATMCDRVVYTYSFINGQYAHVEPVVTKVNIKAVKCHSLSKAESESREITTRSICSTVAHEC